MHETASRPRFELIIGLHDLTDPPVARGEEMMCWNAFSDIETVLDEIVENTRRNGVGLRITSDDAFASDFEILTPWLLERGLSGTFFVPSRHLDQPGRLSTAQVREMASLGMQFGSHGAGHINWATVPEVVFVDDIREGRAQLQELLGITVDLVAPPFGGYSRNVLAHLFKRGFREVHTTRPGLAPVHLPVKPRNILHQPHIGSIVSTSRRAGGIPDILLYHSRQARKTIKAVAGVA